MPKEDPFVNRAQLLKAIKKYPEIWDSNNKLHMCRSVTAPMWNEIAELFGNHVPTVKLQSIWSQMKYHYHNLVHRQILHKERFTTKWEHFEPMSFMYNITVAKIVGSNGQDNGNDGFSSNEMQGGSNLGYDTISPSTQNGKNKSPNKSTMQSQGRGRPSGSFSWISNSNNSKKSSTVLNLPQVPSQEPPEFTFHAFTGLVPPAAVSFESNPTPVRKPGRPGNNNFSMRAKIIDVIKANPILWSGRPKDHRNGQCRTSTVWKEVANELGLTPSLVQTRWSIIKQRYVDELQKERRAQYTGQIFESTWEHFHRMSFMREILIKKVDEREHTREQIQEIVSEHQNLQLQTNSSQSNNNFQPRYLRTPTLITGAGVPLFLPSHLTDCDDSELSGHPITKRRVKAESDLEWDPFEMILQVNGADPQDN